MRRKEDVYKMKEKKLIGSLIMILTILLLFSISSAEVPKTINYQSYMIAYGIVRAAAPYSICMQGETHYLENPYNSPIVHLLSHFINLNMYLGKYVRVGGPEIGVECMITDVQDIEILPSCYSNTDCWDSSQYCAKLEGDCDGSGICNEKPSICPLLYDPVCGCDVMTYPNDCVAAMNGVSIAHQGICLLGDINVDGKVDISDVILDLRLALCLDMALCLDPVPCSDVNSDGKDDILDVILKLRMALGLDLLKQCT